MDKYDPWNNNGTDIKTFTTADGPVRVVVTDSITENPGITMSVNKTTVTMTAEDFAAFVRFIDSAAASAWDAGYAPQVD